MGRVIISGVTGGGVTSDDVTITKAMLPQGYTAVTRDSDDEVVSGENPVVGAQNIVLPINGNAAISKGVHNGQGQVTQSIQILGGQTISPTNYQQVISSASKYMTGNIIVSPVSNLLSQYVKKGISIGNVLGTYEGYEYEYLSLFWDGVNTDGFVLDSGWSWSYPFFWANKTTASFQTAQTYMTGHYKKLVVVCSIGNAVSQARSCFIARTDKGTRLASVRMSVAQTLYYCIADLSDYMFSSKFTISAETGVNIHRIVFET